MALPSPPVRRPDEEGGSSSIDPYVRIRWHDEPLRLGPPASGNTDQRVGRRIGHAPDAGPDLPDCRPRARLDVAVTLFVGRHTLFVG